MKYFNYLMSFQTEAILGRCSDEVRPKLKSIFNKMYDSKPSFTEEDAEYIDANCPPPYSAEFVYLDGTPFNTPVYTNKPSIVHNKYSEEMRCELSPEQLAIFTRIIEAEMTENYEMFNALKEFFRENWHDEYMTLVD